MVVATCKWPYLCRTRQREGSAPRTARDSRRFWPTAVPLLGRPAAPHPNQPISRARLQSGHQTDDERWRTISESEAWRRDGDVSIQRMGGIAPAQEIRRALDAAVPPGIGLECAVALDYGDVAWSCITPLARCDQIRPARMSSSIERIEASSAWRLECRQRQPMARMRWVASRTTGTSPFHPRSPPLYRNCTL